MQSILVTGANKGIGLAIVEAILSARADTFVYLASRDIGRGRAAAAGLAAAQPAFGARIECVALDVVDDESVAEAKARVATHLAGGKLYGVVNNAGVGAQVAHFGRIVDTNTLGVERVCEAFLPLIESRGRIVNVTSASGPIFVASCSEEMQRFFQDASVTLPRLRSFIDDCIAKAGDRASTDAPGLGDGSAYGFSKACANLYTMILARDHAGLHVNACTPGFIETDLTRPYSESQGKSAAELGMKTPAEGAVSTMHLLFGELTGNGHYYGSDSKRSPLDRYRAPGSPAFTGA
jgi:NAD(P)-dependent dehydrogenase (short-subunit alcohol dehydrogenase family)